MAHLKTFGVDRYRGISGLSLPTLNRINLITGTNGIGKTALLESLWLFSGKYNGTLFWDANVLRSRESVVNPIAELSDDEIRLSGREGARHLRLITYFERVMQAVSETRDSQLKSEDAAPIVGRLITKVNNKPIKGPELLQRTPEGLVACRAVVGAGQPAAIFVSTVQEIDTSQEVLRRYSRLVRSRGKSDLESAMQFMFNGYPRVEILTSDSGKPYIAVSRNEGRPLPLRALGGGAVKFFSLYLNFFTARHGLVFFDEIENGVHYSLFRKVWKCIREWAGRWNIQFFATTHSREFIHAAVDSYADRPDDISIHNLFLGESSQTIDVLTYTGDSLVGAKELNLEVR